MRSSGLKMHGRNSKTTMIFFLMSMILMKRRILRTQTSVTLMKIKKNENACSKQLIRRRSKNATRNVTVPNAAKESMSILLSSLLLKNALERKQTTKLRWEKKKKAPRARNIAIPYRRSTRETTRVQSQATEDLTRQRVERAKVVPKKVREPLVRLTQQELLEEAARTEIENKRSLELMLMLQEEKKREKQTAEKQVSKRIIYFSSARNVKVGPDHKPTPPPISTLTFTYVDQVPSVINAKPKPKPERPICSVTGLPAKYRDPVTGIYFRTVEAFKLLRGSHTAPKASGPSSGAL
mmetsp:Transcript_8995/g.15812  ORF Transcript_8995/g.15812 Transcript_8995/m.15812 type:complete len:295 (-) Transcript_8995:100-984(-)